MSDRDTTVRAGGGSDGWIAVVGQWRKGGLRVPVPYTHAVSLAGGNPRVVSTFDLPPGEEMPDDQDVITDLDPYDLVDVVRGAVGPVGHRPQNRQALGRDLQAVPSEQRIVVDRRPLGHAGAQLHSRTILEPV